CSWCGSSARAGGLRVIMKLHARHAGTHGIRRRLRSAVTRCPSEYFSVAWPWLPLSTVIASCTGIGGCCEGAGQSDRDPDGVGAAGRRLRILLWTLHHSAHAAQPGREHFYFRRTSQPGSLAPGHIPRRNSATE